MSLSVVLALLCVSTIHGVVCAPASNTQEVSNEVRSTDLNQLLKRAIMRGRAEVVRHLVNVGADPNARDSFGNTSLHWAAMMDCADCIDALLTYPGPVELEATNAHGMTPLYLAAWYDKPAAITALAAYGAALNVFNGRREALTQATWRGSTAVVKALLEAGADPNVVENITHHASLALAAERGSMECTLLLLMYGANTDTIDQGYNKTPAEIADLKGYKEIAQVIRKWIGTWSDM